MVEINTHTYTQAVQDYLKAIYSLQEQKEPASTSALARRLGMTPAAISKMLKQLAGMKLCEHQKYRGATLTEAGQQAAIEMLRHHRLLELYLYKELGYGWESVHDEAEKLEHHISEDFEARIDRLLNYPRFDPHGDPIPTPDLRVELPDDYALADTVAGDTVVVSRVNDESSEALRYLSSRGIGLGSVLVILEKQLLNGPVEVETEGRVIALGMELAKRIRVKDLEANKEIQKK